MLMRVAKLRSSGFAMSLIRILQTCPGAEGIIRCLDNLLSAHAKLQNQNLLQPTARLLQSLCLCAGQELDKDLQLAGTEKGEPQYLRINCSLHACRSSFECCKPAFPGMHTLLRAIQGRILLKSLHSPITLLP